LFTFVNKDNMFLVIEWRRCSNWRGYSNSAKHLERRGCRETRWNHSEEKERKKEMTTLF